MNLKPTLGDIESNSANLLHVDGSFSCRPQLDGTFGTMMPCEGPSTPSNQVFNDSWVVGFWRADHGEQDVGLER
jgi:hypothetical protein